MSKKNNSNIIDVVDKEILRTLYIRRPLVSSQIAKIIGLSDSAVLRRLRRLKDLGIVKPVKISGIRKFERNFQGKIKKIKSPRSIYWDLDLKKEEL